MTPSDHISTLSEADYARGELREKDAVTRMTPRMSRELNEIGLSLGSPVYIRVFKESRELEIWCLHQASGRYRHFKTWRIAAMSGLLGPKLAEGDFQAPEGFYHAKKSQLRPDSNYHLAINVGYPNRYDLAHKRTGDFIMIHGNRLSAGCLAMTDPSMEEIYTLCHSALANGQPFFRIHIFPFRMTDERLAGETQHRWYDFWMNLKEGYDWFEEKETPPDVSVKNKRYVFQ
ncbi:MAG: murein L,D-transpeptidase [Akkermansiaceae bacterium]|nr:murein L,D-transpeptidase [Akkermansiaceae bacterium]